MTVSALPRDVLGAICDANGNATIRLAAPAHFYALAYITVQASSGGPLYVVQLAVGSPLAVGIGQNTQLGPFLLQPGERATLAVSGAPAGATINGLMAGWQSPAIEDFPAILPLTPGAVAITGTATVTISGTPSVTISGTPTVNATITGTPTVNIGNTPSVTISAGSVTATISGTPNINIQSQSVTLNQKPSLAAWSESGGVSLIAAGGNVTVISGVGGQIVTLYRGYLQIQQGIPAGQVNVQDSVGQSVIFSGSEAGPLAVIEFLGLQLVSGRGLIIYNPNASAVRVADSFQYTQA